MSAPTADPPLLLAERLEAEVRQLMAAHAQHGPARGWDSERARAMRLRAIDLKLDAYNRATR